MVEKQLNKKWTENPAVTLNGHTFAPPLAFKQTEEKTPQTKVKLTQNKKKINKKNNSMSI